LLQSVAYGGEILGDVTERLVDCHVSSEAAPFGSADQDFPDFSGNMVVADQAFGLRSKELRGRD